MWWTSLLLLDPSRSHDLDHSETRTQCPNGCWFQRSVDWRHKMQCHQCHTFLRLRNKRRILRDTLSFKAGLRGKTGRKIDMQKARESGNISLRCSARGWPLIPQLITRKLKKIKTTNMGRASSTQSKTNDTSPFGLCIAGLICKRSQFASNNSRRSKPLCQKIQMRAP